MGYTMGNGQWADTKAVSLFDGTATETGAGEAVELGDRGSIRLTLDVEVAKAKGTDEVQAVAVADASGGTFTLAFGDDETDPIAHDAMAEDVQAALEALESIGAGNVECTGGPLGADPVTVTFVGDLGSTDVDALVADDTLLDGVGAAVTVTTVTPGAPGSPTLDVTVETGPDGSTWATLGTFTQATAPGTERKLLCPVDRFVRAKWTVAGTDPAITFSLSGEAV